ncbi:MAG: BrnT family toxin [Methylococcales symbiont of Hymedesmia sp. n. MRB-2018]|nr:MAG: BrnT family toxin [Methylococcales symbiont of Hymedesmia sp. n. MRB-2018]
MKKVEFEWDNNKDRINTSKHGVSFDEAQTAFYDEYAIQFFDPEHSASEVRFLLLGMSFKLKTLVVCHCFREEETVVRIVSARKADKDESKAYWSKRK